VPFQQGLQFPHLAELLGLSPQEALRKAGILSGKFSFG
jgi:hypothetical protein